MSIILDALKKMEGEGAAKGSREIPVPSEKPLTGRKRGLLLPLATAVIALNLVAVGLWLGQRDGPHEKGAGEILGSPVESGLAAAPAGALPQAAAAPAVERPIPSPEPRGLPPAPAAGAAENRGQGTAKAAPVLSPAAPVVETQPAPAPLPPAVQKAFPPTAGMTGEDVSAVEERESYDGSVLSVEELPGDLRPGVEDLDISAHVYSDDPAFRLVAVNDTLKREGDAVAVDLVVEEITERGAVFRYRGYRFKMSSR